MCLSGLGLGVNSGRTLVRKKVMNIGWLKGRRRSDRERPGEDLGAPYQLRLILGGQREDRGGEDCNCYSGCEA